MEYCQLILRLNFSDAGFLVILESVVCTFDISVFFKALNCEIAELISLL